MVKQIVAVLAAVTLVVAGSSQVALAGGNYHGHQNKKVNLKIEKEWTVAEDPDGLFNEQDVEVRFEVKVFRDWRFKYSKDIAEGEKVRVKKGDFVVIKEEVTGLDELCTYEANDLKTKVKSRKKWQKHTVTNTVTCEELPEDPEEPKEEPEPQTLSTVTEEKQVVAPVGAVDAGSGSGGAGASAAIGLLVSVAAVGAGAALRKPGSLSV